MERWTKATLYADMWLDPADDPREAPPVDYTEERATLNDYLRRYRLTLELKCADLTPSQLALRSVPPSTMSLLGLVRHMAEVERSWFRRRLAGQDAPHLYGKGNGDWDGAFGEQGIVDEAWASWRSEVAFAEEFVSSTPDLAFTASSGVVLRDVMVHLIEEYARHCGHADLLRECIDGRVGQ